MGEFLLAWDKLQNLKITFFKCFYLKEIMGWTSGSPEIMENIKCTLRRDDLILLFISPNLGSLIRNAPVICNLWMPPPPTHTPPPTNTPTGMVGG